jgi:Protein of unknown function (DUF4232)
MSGSSQRAWRRRTPAAVMCVAAAIGAAAVSSTGASAHSAGAASAPRCTTAHLEIWFGLGLGGGTAGSTFYPLEFSNVGHHACTLNGFPGVSGYGNSGGQVGPAASRNGQPHATVTLVPGATAHAILRVLDSGALCSPSVQAAGLKVFPPGATRSQPIPFSFSACAHRGVLIVGPVRAGVGIPGFTTS